MERFVHDRKYLETLVGDTGRGRGREGWSENPRPLRFGTGQREYPVGDRETRG